METIPEPDWKRQLELCNQYLEYDERNCKIHISDTRKITNSFLIYLPL